MRGEKMSRRGKKREREADRKRERERELERELPPKLDLVACALLLLILASST